MKTQIFLVSTWLLATVALLHADPLTVAVYDFNDTDRGGNFGEQVGALVTADLASETNFVMLERAELDKALREQAFGVSGMVSADAAAKIGQMTGAKVLVAGQVVKNGDSLVIIADIIGTETGRLFATQMRGAPNNLADLTQNLCRDISQTISAQTTNLVLPPVQSHDEWLNRLVKNLAGTKRPSVSVTVLENSGQGNNWRDSLVENELGLILLKAGFAVVDENSKTKPDVEITGVAIEEFGLPHGGLQTGRAEVQFKVQERQTSTILGFDNDESTATDISPLAAGKAAQVKATDQLAERILPLLAK
jgi:TolB-like protein